MMTADIGTPAMPEDITPRQPPATAPKKNRTNMWILIGLAVVILTTAGVVAGVLVSRASTFTLTGDVTVSDPVDTILGTGASDVEALGGNLCELTDGYSDIRGGATVTITDASGAIIAIGELDGEGKASGVYACRFTFSVPKVPEGKHFYGVEISHRGVVRMTENEARQQVSLTLGGN